MDNPEKLATQGTQDEEDKTKTQRNICRTLKLLCELAPNFAVMMFGRCFTKFIMFIMKHVVTTGTCNHVSHFYLKQTNLSRCQNDCKSGLSNTA